VYEVFVFYSQRGYSFTSQTFGTLTRIGLVTY